MSSANSGDNNPNSTDFSSLGDAPTMAGDGPVAQTILHVPDRATSPEVYVNSSWSDQKVSNTLNPSDNSRYQLTTLIGVGGMGHVHLAADERMGRNVALKLLRPEHKGSEHHRNRFMREARIQAQLEHPAIVPVYDMGSGPDDELFFTMRRVKGIDLAEVLKQLASNNKEFMHRYSRRKLLSAFSNVCLAVHYAHTRGVVHRDLKPSNIMFGEFGEVSVLDWGIAKVLSDKENAGSVNSSGSLVRTAQGTLVGSLGYMSPEQMQGNHHSVGPASDIYSLGAILFEILTFRPLHTGTLVEIATSTNLGKVDPPSRYVQGLAQSLDEICLKATALQATDRYATARELADAVENFLDGELDEQKRLERANHHSDLAVASFAKSADKTVDPTEAQKARSVALREVLAALALNPEHNRAKHTLRSLLTDLPEVLPPGAQAEIAKKFHETRLKGTLFALLTAVWFAFFVPLFLWAGVRSWKAIGVATLAHLMMTGSTAWTWFKKQSGPINSIVMGVSILFLLGMLSGWLSPFILVPGLATSGAFMLASHSNDWEAQLVKILCPLVLLIPLLAEYLQWVPPSFTFQNGALVILPRGLYLPPVQTTVLLIFTNLGTIMGTPLMLGVLHKDLKLAERRLILQSWQLRQLLPD